MSFHARLRELREAANLTQDGLAERAGLSRAGIAQLESGRRKPALETAQKLATALGVGVEAFAVPPGKESFRGPGRPRKTPTEGPTGELSPAAEPKKRTPVKRKGKK